jgi:hypothetical protein
VKFIDIDLHGTVFRARLLEERSPQTTAAIWEALPFKGRVAHGQWSGAMFRMLDEAPVDIPAGDRGVGFQYPGLVVLNPGNKELAFCYGQGRLNTPTGPLNPIPVAEIGGDLVSLAEFGESLQFDGAKPVRIGASADQESPLETAPEPRGRAMEVVLGDSVTQATLLEDESPKAASAFASLLPARGRATNTYSSGPLVRFWNDEGGPQGETPLEVENLEPGQVILYPSYLYYLPMRPYRGVRIPIEATAMGGAVSRGTTQLVPFARFTGDWSGFREEALRLIVDGAKTMEFRLKDVTPG